MCNICGIVSEKFRPESAYWGKMCEYVTKGKTISAKGCYASGRGESFSKEFSGSRYLVVFDGKIHNLDALKRSLGLRGAVFETENTAELVLLYYIFLGENCFKLFKGEFSIVVWDGTKQQLLLVRDKVGFNTLFYYFDGIRLIFSSEIKGVLKFPCVKKDLCDDIYCKLFALTGGRTPGETLFSKIFEIPPGCYVKYKNSVLTVENYHMFSVSDATDTYAQTVNGLKYLCKNDFGNDFMQEKPMTKLTLKENIKLYLKMCDLPSPYVDLKTLSNIASDDKFFDLTSIFCAPERFKLPSVWCKKQEREYVNGFLSTLPFFEFKDEKDIQKKEEIYIKQYIVIPQVVYAKRKMCKNIFFPFLKEETAAYSLNNIKYAKKLAGEFGGERYKRNKENYKNLKTLFSEMILSKNAMSGLIEKEELLKFTRLFPRPETMLYLLQVDMWLNMFL